MEYSRGNLEDSQTQFPVHKKCQTYGNKTNGETSMDKMRVLIGKVDPGIDNT